MSSDAALVQRARGRCSVSAKAEFGGLLLLLLLLSSGGLRLRVVESSHARRVLQFQASNMVNAPAADLFCCLVCSRTVPLSDTSAPMKDWHVLLNAPADAPRVCKTCKTKLATLGRAAVNAFRSTDAPGAFSKVWSLCVPC